MTSFTFSPRSFHINALCLTQCLFLTVYFPIEHNIYCSVVSMHRTPLPLCVCEGGALSHVKVPARKRENHFPDFLSAKQHCHLVLNRDWLAHSHSLSLRVVKMRAHGLRTVNFFKKSISLYEIPDDLFFSVFGPCRSFLWTELNLRKDWNFLLKWYSEVCSKVILRVHTWYWHYLSTVRLIIRWSVKLIINKVGLMDGYRLDNSMIWLRK